MTEFLNVEIKAGEPVKTGDHTVTPFAQSVTFTIPGWTGGLIWNRPVSVLVESPDGKEEVLPVVDVTRQAQFGLAGAAIGAVAITWMITRIIRKFR